MRRLLRFISDQSTRLSAKFNDFVRHTRLDNGAEFASQRRFMDKKLRFQVAIKTGSLDNPEGKNGLAHFLEHVLYSSDVSNEFKARGGFVNAYTNGHEISVYGNLDNTPENAEYLIDVVRDVLTASVKPEDYEREKRRILNEIGIYLDNADHVHNSMLKKAFGGAAYICDNLGSAENVRSITIEDLETFKHKWFVGQNTVIVMTGVSDHKGMETILNEALSGVPATPTPKHKVATFTPVDHREDNAQVHQLYVSLGYSVDPVDTRQNMVNSLARSCISNMLQRRFLSQTGLVYSIGALGIASSARPGFFEIKGNMLPELAGDFMPDIAKILGEASTKLDAATFDQAKKSQIDYLDTRKGILPMAIHGLGDLHYDLLNYGRPLTVDEETELLKSITREEVQVYIGRIVENEPALIAYGDSKNLHSRDEFMDILEAEKFRIQQLKPDDQKAFEVS